MKHRWKPGAKIYNPSWNFTSYVYVKYYHSIGNTSLSVTTTYPITAKTSTVTYSGNLVNEFKLYELESL